MSGGLNICRSTDHPSSRSNYYFDRRFPVHTYHNFSAILSFNEENNQNKLSEQTMPSKSRQRCRVAWLEPIDADESPKLSPLNLEDIFILDSLNTYSWIALAGIFWAVFLTILGVGRPALFAVVAVVHCAVVGLVAGVAAISARIWPSGEAIDDNATKT